MAAAHQRVFISYARQDGRPFAEKLESELRSVGFRVWLDKRDIDPDQDFTAQIEDAIEASSHVVVCVTPDSKRKESFVRREIQYALLCHPPKPIIPLLFADIPPHIHINTRTWIDFLKQEWNAAFGELLEFLKRPLTAYENRGPVERETDPYQAHVEELLQHVLGEVRARVIDMFGVSEMLPLSAVNRPDAVAGARAVRQAYRVRRPQWLGGSADSANPQTFDSFSDAFQWHKRRLLLLGEPGAGKTTTLLALARDAAYARLSDRQSPVPVYAPAYTWSDANEPFVEWLERVTGLSKGSLDRLIDQQEILLLIDGIDELAFDIGTDEAGIRPYDYCVEFMRSLSSLPAVPALVTCRVKDYERIVERGGEKIALNGAVSLEALSEEQIEHYLHDQPDLLAAVKTDPNLRQMVRTPLLLSLLAAAYRDAGSEAADLRDLRTSSEVLRQRIFEVYLRRRYEFEQVRAGDKALLFSVEQIEEYLSEAAFLAIPAQLQGDNSELSESEIEFAVFEKLIPRQAAAFGDLIVRLHLVLAVGQSRFRFIHMLMRDYFAGLMLQRLRANDSAAWSAVMRYYQADLFQFVSKRLVDRGLDAGLTDEIMQLTWDTCVQKIDSFQFSGSGRMYYWLVNIAYGHVQMQARAQNRLQDVANRIEADRQQDMEQDFIAREQRRVVFEALENALSELMPQDREIVMRRIINNESVESIALAMGVRVQTVYQIVSRVKRKLRNDLLNSGFDDLLPVE